MLERLDKISIYMAVALLGYLGYSALEQRQGLANERKETSTIAKAMLHPKLIEPTANASPADRDPFLIQWDAYSADARHPGQSGLAEGKAGDPAGTERASKLTGVLASPDGRNVAVIDGKAYEAGSLVANGVSGAGWRIAEIGQDRVVLEQDGVTRVLKIVNAPASPHDANTPGRGREHARK